MAQKAGYNGIKKLNPPLDITTEGTMFVDMAATLSSIAPTEAGDKFAAPYNIGDEFYLADGKLYKATKQITADDSIIIYPTENYNVVLAGSVTEQLGALSSNKVGWDVAGKSVKKNYYNLDDIAWSTSLTLTKSTSGFTASSESSGSNANVSNKKLNLEVDEQYTASIKVDALSGDSGKRLAYRNSSGVIQKYVDFSATGKYELTFTAIEGGYLSIFLRKESGSAGSADSLTVSEVMICPASIADPTYVPFIYDNTELEAKKVDNSVIAPVENGTTVQKSDGYAVGSHAIRNGAFITWKNAKAQGETINDASDYDSGDVADILNRADTSLTVSTGITADINQIRKVCNVASIYLRITTPSDLSSNITLGSVTEDLRPSNELVYLPVYEADAPCKIVGAVFIRGNNGNLDLVKDIVTSSTKLVISGSWLTRGY